MGFKDFAQDMEVKLSYDIGSTSWEQLNRDMLKEIKDRLRVNPADASAVAIKNVADQLVIVKNVIRNETIHNSDHTYTDEQAHEIYYAIRGLMRPLVTR